MQVATDTRHSPMSLSPQDKIYSKDQHRGLEEHFRMDGYPDYTARAVLAARLNLKEPQVRAWFLTRRAADTRLQPQPPMQQFLGRSRRFRVHRALHTRIHKVSRGGAEGSRVRLHRPPSSWECVPADKPSFSCCGWGCSTQEDVTAPVGPQDPSVLHLSPDVASSRDSTELPAPLEAFRRLSISSVTSGCRDGGDIADKVDVEPGPF